VPETFVYKVRDAQGQVIEGELAADNATVVTAKLREMGYIPIEIQKKEAGLKKEISIGGNKVKLKDLAIFSRQFATMINSGLSLLRSLNILAEQTESKPLRETVRQVRDEIEGGGSLSSALAKHPKVFNDLYVSMVRSGETGGNLDLVLIRLAETIEKQVALRGEIKSAMTYPVVVFVMVILIVTGMLIFIVPMFENLYKELGGTLPAPTRMLIGISNLVKGFWWLLILLGIAFFFGLRAWKKTESGRMFLDAFKIKVPVFGPLFHKVSLSRFSRTLSDLIRSGVPILESLDIVSGTVNNAVVSKAILAVQESVKSGESIARPLLEHPVFPPMVVQMIAVGEETGALDTMLTKIADFYDQEIEATVQALTSLIEPILIAVMGAAVGGMVIALYMPMFNIVNLIK
jgi:type IV pilus assembly protein PilC